MHYVAGVDSVHTAAAICDYLQDHLDEDDTVVVVAVDENQRRDAADAANVVQVRLFDGDVTIETREGDPASEILTVAEETNADTVVIGPHRGEPGCGPGVGSTASALLRDLDIPVVVVPVPKLAPE